MTSFRRVDPHQTYLYGLYTGCDASIPSSAFTCGGSNFGAVLPTSGIYRSNYSPVSPAGSAWAEHVPSPAQCPKWSKPVFIDTGVVQWMQQNEQQQREYGCGRMAAGAYRHGSVTSNTVTPVAVASRPQAAASGLPHCSADSPKLAAIQRQQQHCTAASSAHSSVTCRPDDDDDDDVTLRQGVPASPHSATYQSNPADSTGINFISIYLNLIR